AGLPEAVDLPVGRVRRLRPHAVLPADRRHETGRLGRDAYPCPGAEAELARPALKWLAAVLRQQVELVADVVEVRVARLGERGRQSHLRVRVRVPVVED